MFSRLLEETPTFDGTTQSFAAVKAQFENAMSFNDCNEREQLAHLKSCLISVAAQTLWDTSRDQTDTLPKLWKLLEDRFGGRKVVGRCRTELRGRKRRVRESLNHLFLDIKRLMAIGYLVNRSRRCWILSLRTVSLILWMTIWHCWYAKKNETPSMMRYMWRFGWKLSIVGLLYCLTIDNK